MSQQGPQGPEGQQGHTDTYTLIKKKQEVARNRPLGFRCLKPRTRWRSLVRQVLTHLSWLTVTEEEPDQEAGGEAAAGAAGAEDREEDHEAVHEGAQEQGKPGPTSLAALLTQRRKRTGDLSLYEKGLLRRPHDERTDKEKEVLASLFSSLRCFRRYPEQVRGLLAGYVSFECYGSGRVITRVGQRVQGMYFVLNGTLDQWRPVQDPLSGPRFKLHNTLGPGDAFGEVSLLHDTPRLATTITTSVVEVLLLQKRDFDNVLKASIMKTWEEIRAAMATFPYFQHWSEVDMRETCILAKICHYKSGDTILGDGHGQPNMTYFLIAGRARLIQHLLLVPRASSGLIAYRCLPPGTPTGEGRPPDAHTHFMQVAILSKGECFGVGEDMTDRRVVADGPVSALLVPRYALLQRGRGNLWTRVRRFLDGRFPTQDALFKEFLNGRDWAKFRRDLVLQALQRGRPAVACTTLHDVPLSLRTRECIPSEKHTCYELGRLPDPRAWRWRAARRQRAAVETRVRATKREHRVEQARREPAKGVKFAA